MAQPMPTIAEAACAAQAKPRVASLHSTIATAASPTARRGEVIKRIPTRTQDRIDDDGINGLVLDGPHAGPQSSPEIVRRPPIQTGQKAMIVRIGKSSFVFLFAIIALVGVMLLAFPDETGKQLSDFSRAVMMPLHESLANVRRSIQPARLGIESQTGFANEPLPLGISLKDASGGETVTVAGLAEGAELSLGTSLGSAAWLVSAGDLDKTFVGAPKDFVGIMEVAVSLRSAGDQLLDRQVIRLEWIEKNGERLTPRPNPPKPDPPQQAQVVQPPKPDPPQQAQVVQPPKPDPPQQAQVVQPPKPGPPQQAQVVQSLNPDDIATLIKVAKDFLQRGDIASARISLKRAAIAGNAQAALELGKTFDQAFLAKWGVLGFAADPAQARDWYDRAVELGSAEASQHLARLASMPR